jgi:hypothetical protein
MRHPSGFVRLACLAAGIALASASALAQIPGAPETYGNSPIVRTLQAFEFQPYSIAYAGSVEANTFRSRYCSALPGCFWQAPLFLPAGAVIDSVVLDGCDGHNNGAIRVELRRIGAGETSDDQMAFATTTPAGQPGCSATLLTATPTAHTIDNVAYTYWIEVGGGSSVDLRFQAVRVYYRLQVSPTPVTATFGDVPVGHPFHRFVEAFARAGITGGCSPAPNPNFCPNDPVTRGQMAVFMSAALGLHFTP